MTVWKLCPKCQGEIVSFEGVFGDYHYCSKCYNYLGEDKSKQTDQDNCCKAPDQHFVWHPIKNGTQLRKQCNHCGRVTTSSISQKGVDTNGIEFEDEELTRDRSILHDRESGTFEAKVQSMYNKHIKSVEADIGLKHDGYEKYLKTKEWRVKRTMVLERDKGLCQSCRIADATDVHHLNYRHLFNEPLFDLISVCRRCHEIITKLDQYQVCNEKIHVV